ncbi:protein NO VEIN domain-containing protein [Rudaeicoccus suwonensis]|uniref:EVE domain-containing protein n=1 Tax=Rudaeicoccus suwonensis TaxID=657409 RepID=A0A561E3V4_9MICO|nr:DUF3883 domain-containing protein [Rudaeicoccus suwonensis]TWE10279.1 EVE domain-containing protein [Rudaeicoccus suwonensis]
MNQHVTREKLGSWLVKCNSDLFDLAGHVSDDRGPILDWSVQPGYRADLMSPGDRLIFWVSGHDPLFQRGIWGCGYVTDYVQDAIPDDFNADDVGYWRDPEKRAAVRSFVPCHIPLFEKGVTVREIRAAGLDDLEVLRAPMCPNPSWLSVDQMRLLGVLLEWPDDTPNPGHQVTVTSEGAGFGDAQRNAVVEAAAMAAVQEFYGDDWEGEDVSADKIGWDITFRSRSGPESYKVEVKGVSGSRPTILLTANERRAAQDEPGWWLAVVTHALSNPTIREYTGEDVVTAAKPYIFRVQMPEARD